MGFATLLLVFRKDADVVVSLVRAAKSSPNPAWEGERGPGLICKLLRSTSGPERKIRWWRRRRGLEQVWKDGMIQKAEGVGGGGGEPIRICGSKLGLKKKPRDRVRA
jgi:hypothetical protein